MNEESIPELKARLLEINNRLYEIVIDLVDLTKEKNLDTMSIKSEGFTKEALNLLKESLKLSAKLAIRDPEEGRKNFSNYNLSRNIIYDGLALLRAYKTTKMSEDLLRVIAAGSGESKGNLN